MTAITRALSAALLHFVWQGLGVTILLWLALFLLRKRSAALRYVVCCAALALLVALPAITTWVLYEAPVTVYLTGVPVGVNVLQGSGFVSSNAGPDWFAQLQALAIPVWACGVLLFSFRMAWGCSQIANMRRAGKPAGGELRSVVTALADRMGVTRPVRI